jgi:starvation-inducible DNA-binding protein
MQHNKRGPIAITKKTAKSPYQNTANALKTLEADLYTVYLKTQYYHWNVVGPQFHSLHEMFDQQYHELADAVDVIAERIRALGQTAPGSFHEFMQLKTIPEAKSDLDAQGMIQDLIDSHQALLKTINKTLEIADKEEDEATENMMAERLEAHEKIIWMLKSNLA